MSNQLPQQGSSASAPRSPVCPLCGVFPAPTGLLLTGDAVHGCADHGCYIVGPSTYWQPKEWDVDALPRLTADVQQIGLWLAFKCLLAGADGDYLLVDDLDEPGQYVQLELQGHGDGTIYVEVGSRDWADSHRPLLPGAIAALDGLGFLGRGVLPGSGWPHSAHAAPICGSLPSIEPDSVCCCLQECGVGTGVPRPAVRSPCRPRRGS